MEPFAARRSSKFSPLPSNQNRACGGSAHVLDSSCVQLHRIIRILRRVVKPALAGLLAVLLLVTTTASASHLLHRALHGNAASPNHNCVICLFAKGQVSTADGVATLAAFVAVFFFTVSWNSVPALASIDLRLSPSRAPPA